jgi:hypothetical protein
VKKIDKRYFTFVFASFMSVLMSAIISFCTTFYQFGFSEGIFMKFLAAWQFSLPFAFVAAQFVAPTVRKLTMIFVEA